MRFVKFVLQFVNFCSGLVQSLFADCRDPVDSTTAPCNILEDRPQQAAALQSMKERVERSRSNVISVMAQLLHHCQPEDWLVIGMHQHVNPYESEEEFSLLL